MTQPLESFDALVAAVLAAPRQARRRLVAVAGAPGSGKSTLAARLADALAQAGCRTQVVPMDGFHLDNRLLIAMNLLGRKGAPETFDVGGFRRLMAALGADTPVYYPLFDRTRDIAIASAGCLDEACDTVIVEGNYLLLDAPDWRALHPLWDLRVRLDVPMETLRSRLIDRWLDEGLAEDAAIARAEGNDLRNARLVDAQALAADMVFDGAAS
ncbi:nucleoside/nucleotide kinase family protein [Roseobacter sinensis]|uniref:Nucleoside/nucleotide kinase family protein n=1 Tax=Roseobacter sinensis TaxID=2931391 RepID=A0ABT3BHU2_9RHOB|nr:nucleoside/nucleotide kinase family protein [Roseobacter sp. WL0113]MCV3273150.1 nucleoside/nucleotide kinase family protein [Roseobacter sp. WL0113]